jgi:hypothetical protein
MVAPYHFTPLKLENSIIVTIFYHIACQHKILDGVVYLASVTDLHALPGDEQFETVVRRSYNMYKLFGSN